MILLKLMRSYDVYESQQGLLHSCLVALCGFLRQLFAGRDMSIFTKK